jgi:hydroxyacylglutathione hydrolase
MILQSAVVSIYGTNCYVLGSESTKNGIVIDPGGDAEIIESMINKWGLNIRLVIATHVHGDHVGALKPVLKFTGAKFAIHEDPAIGFSAQAVGNGRELNSPYFGELTAPDIWLKDGQSIAVDDLTFKVVHTPGHTSGGICLIGDGIVFSGDTLFNYGIGRTDFPGGDYDVLLSSIKNKLMVLPEDTIVYPGHGPSTTIRNERRGNPFLR